MAAANKKLEGKVAIITGSSSGLGEGFALMFAAEGALISLTGRNETELKRVEAECKALGAARVIYTAGDITSDVLRKKLVQNTVSAFGKIDILVNNAGVPSKICDITEPNFEDFDFVQNVNVRSVYHMSALVTPYLIKTKGNIVNISSGAALKPMVGSSAYCVSKAALDMLTKCLAAELAPHQVRVNGINAGAFKTNLLRYSIPDKGDQDKMFEEFGAKLHALGRLGEIKEIAAFVTFLASEDASFMTGSNVPCDGGFMVKN